jgi:hypothetical protein
MAAISRAAKSELIGLERSNKVMVIKHGSAA